MSCLWAVILIFTLTFNLSESEAKHHRKRPLHNHPVLVGTVHCDTCSSQDPSQFHVLPGASVAVECKNVDPIFRQKVVTDRNGEFRVRLPFRENVDGCSVEILRSIVASCAVPAVKTASKWRLKSTAHGGLYSPGMLTFRPMNLPHFCDQKQSLGRGGSSLPSLPTLPSLPQLPRLPPLPSLPSLPLLQPPGRRKGVDGTPTAADSRDKDGAQLPTADFPFPPNPFLPPPSIFPPNPFQPPPSIFPPLFPTPPPSIFPPIFPAPPTPPMFPPLFPPIPGLLPTPSPPPPPAFPIPLPPFPFQPTPGFPGVPPKESKENSP